MEKLYINLDSSIDRRISFETNHIGFSRVQAIDPTTMPLNIVRFQPYMSDTEICCYLSHLKCWEIIASSIYDYGLVCQDDVLVQFEPSELIIPQADFIHINTELSVAKPNETVECSFEDLNRKSTSCYIISKELCIQLVQQFRDNPIAYIADMFSYYMPKAKVFSINTELFSYTEHSLKSTVQMGLVSEIKRILKQSVTTLNIVE